MGWPWGWMEMLMGPGSQLLTIQMRMSARQAEKTQRPSQHVAAQEIKPQRTCTRQGKRSGRSQGLAQTLTVCAHSMWALLPWHISTAGVTEKKAGSPPWCLAEADVKAPCSTLRPAVLHFQQRKKTFKRSTLNMKHFSSCQAQKGRQPPREAPPHPRAKI